MTDKKTQLDKFKEAARELETDDDEARFDAALKKIAGGATSIHGADPRRAELLTKIETLSREIEEQISQRPANQDITELANSRLARLEELQKELENLKE